MGHERTLGGAITSPNHVVEPGVIVNEQPDRNTLWVGEIDDRQTPRIEALRKTLIAAGIGSPSTRDIRYDIWHKLMANLTGSSISLILGQPSTIQKTPIVNRLARRAHAEALAVAAAHGVMLDDSPDVRYGPKRVYFDHRPSILQDYDLGRPMEIEAIVRAPVAFARSAGVPTPTLDAIETFAVSMATSKGLYAPVMLIAGGAPLQWRVMIHEMTRHGVARPSDEFVNTSARHARRAVGNVVEGQGHRDAGVVAHQGDDIGDADVAERLDRAVVEAARHPAARWRARSPSRRRSVPARRRTRSACRRGSPRPWRPAARPALACRSCAAVG